MLELRLFGVGQARYGDHPLEGFPNQQCYLLLCHLVLSRPHPQPRERLAALFWADYPAQASRKYLRNALWRLRQALQSAGAPVDAYLLIDDDRVAFRDSDAWWLDTEAFETGISRHQNVAASRLTSEQAQEIETAVDLYTGDLLDSVYEDWCLYERERLFLLYLSGLSKLMLYHAANGTYERGLACGERILARDNTRERVHRQMMQLHWLRGDRASALAQYKRCAQILREELGLRPMEQTEQLYQKMMRNQYDAGNESARTPMHPATAPEESLQSLTRHALERLHRLQAIAEETSDELHHIERLISAALLGPHAQK